MANIYLFKDKLWKEIYDFRYTGNPQQFHLNKGKYFILCDGARGGTGLFDYRSYGGRAMGILDLKVDSDLYAMVGGDGETTASVSVPGKGGWNGGGDGGYSDGSYSCGNGGGGASDVRLSLDETVPEGVPEGFSNTLCSRIIVGAGSGGGTRLNSENRMDNIELIGTGGGEVGSYAGGDTEMEYATQSSGYAFGIGQQPIRKIYEAYGAEGSGGGGGGWFGGISNQPTGEYTSGAGGGGSSYVLTETSWKPESSAVPSSNYYFIDQHLEAGVATYPRIIVAEECTMPSKDDVIIAYCTGRTEQLPASANMTFNAELYGGCGGSRLAFAKCAKGGYTSGKVKIKSTDKIYLTVGGTGLAYNMGTVEFNNKFRPTLGFNGGGYPGTLGNSELVNGAAGGGASDIRICVPHPKQTIPDEINFIKILFYERKAEYRNLSDGTSKRWFQLSEMDFYTGENVIPISSIYAFANEQGTKPVTYYSGAEVTENISNLVDGDLSTKFGCQWEDVINVKIELSSPVNNIDKYIYTTAGDFPGRDPVAWKIYVSSDEEEWVLLDNHFDKDYPDTRDTSYTIMKNEFDINDKPTLHNRILVAGGAGGQGRRDAIAGEGGGTTGGVNTTGYQEQQSGPGTQTEAPTGESRHDYGVDGTFGQGGRGWNKDGGAGGAGGGGWFGGSGTVPDYSADDDRCGCGGSGYILTADSFRPPCYGYGLNDERLYIEDGSTINGGNNLSIPETMIKLTVIDIDLTKILAGDEDGTKYYDKNDDEWKWFTDNIPGESDFIEHGHSEFPTDKGLKSEYVIYTYTGVDNLIVDNANVGIVPPKQNIVYQKQSTMKPRSTSFDIEYNPSDTTIEIDIMKEGVGDLSILKATTSVDKHKADTIEKLYSIRIEAGLDVHGNMYIPPAKTPDDAAPKPRPGDEDYVKKYLLKVGTHEDIPYTLTAYLPTYGSEQITEVLSSTSREQNREIYSILKLKTASTTFYRFIKYNTISKTSTVIKDFNESFWSDCTVGDFIVLGDYLFMTPNSLRNNYKIYRYNMNTGELTSNSMSGSPYITAFGRMEQVDDETVAIPYRYGIILFNVVKNTYELKSVFSSSVSHSSFCKGNKYYLLTTFSNASTVYVINVNTFEGSTFSLPASTDAVATYYNGKFYIAQNGYLHIVNEDTLTIEKTIVTNWNTCRTLRVSGGVCYATSNNSKRVWMYSILDDRNYSLYIPWELTYENRYGFYPVLFNGSFWLAHWSIVETSYRSKSKYYFGQKYGLYEIKFSEENKSLFTYDDRFVDFYDTHVEVHDAVIKISSEKFDGMTHRSMRLIKMNKENYNLFKSCSFDITMNTEE